MRRALLWLAGPLCVLAALGVAWLFELSTEHVLALAPVIVVGHGRGRRTRSAVGESRAGVGAAV